MCWPRTWRDEGRSCRLRQRREWRAIKPMLVGTVSATEVTHGAAGWHVHFHEIAFVQAETEAEAVALFFGYGPRLGRVPAWLRA